MNPPQRLVGTTVCCFRKVLALLLLLLSNLRTLGDSQSMALPQQGPGFCVRGSDLGVPPWVIQLVFLALAMVFTHALFGPGLLGNFTRPSLRAWPTLKATPKQHLLLWFVVVTIGLLAHNAAIYSTSSLGEPYADPS